MAEIADLRNDMNAARNYLAKALDIDKHSAARLPVFRAHAILEASLADSAASPTPPSMGVTLPSEEELARAIVTRKWTGYMADAMWRADYAKSLAALDSGEWFKDMGCYVVTQAVLDARAILQLIDRKNGRKP